MISAIAILLAIIVVIFPQNAWIYLVIIGVFELFVLYVAAIKKAPYLNGTMRHKLSAAEHEMWERYSTFMSYPMTGRSMSRGMSFIQLLSVAVGVYLLFRGEYAYGIIIALNYFAAAPLAVSLNPQFYFHDNGVRGNAEAAHNFEVITSALEKLHDLDTTDRQGSTTEAAESGTIDRNWEDIN